MSDAGQCALICGLLAFIACMVTGLLFKACEILAELRKR